MGALLSSDLLGSELPRLWTKPLRPLTPETSRGFEAAEFAEDVLGISLLPWQRWALIHLLELLEDGSFRFRTVVLLVARQNGKTTLLQIVALWRMYVDAAKLVIGTAQNLDQAEETWQGAVDMAEGVPELAAEIENIDRRNGKNTLILQTGERYKVAAASRRGGRGLSGDLVLFDELREHQTWHAWAAVSKTTMARARAQVLCASNAGDRMSVVLTHLRGLGLATVDGGGDQSIGLFEYSAPEGCDPADPAGWVWANPAMGSTIGVSTVASAMGTDPEEIFRTEVLCQWVDTLNPVIDPVLWGSLAEPGPRPLEPFALALDMPWDRSSAVIAVAGRSQAGHLGVELVCGPDVCEHPEHQRGSDWAVTRVTELVEKYKPCALVVETAGPAGSEITKLEAAELTVVKANAREMAQACGHLFDAVAQGTLRHQAQEPLDLAVSGAATVPIGDAWRWTRKKSTGVDISPLVGVTLALWGYVVHGPETYSVLESVY